MNKFWQIKNILGDDSAELDFFGEVVSERPRDWWTGEEIEGQFIIHADFVKDLERIKNVSKLTINLSSFGGDLFAGIAIYNALKQLPAAKTVNIMGIAASAASVIAMAGDTIRVGVGSAIMIHDAMVGVCGMLNAEEMKAAAKVADKCSECAANIYAARTGLPKDRCRSLMKAETWFVGQQAIDEGFATELLSDVEEPIQAMLVDNKKFLVCNGIKTDVSAFRNIPAKYTFTAQQAQNKLKPKGQNKMTIEEVKNSAPEVFAAIEAQAIERAKADNAEIIAKANADAIKNERKRISEIMDIADCITDKEMVRNAMFGENPIDAKTLSFEAMKARKAVTDSVMKGIKNDASALDDVVGAPKTEPQNSGAPKSAQQEYDGAKVALADAAKLLENNK